MRLEQQFLQTALISDIADAPATATQAMTEPSLLLRVALCVGIGSIEGRKALAGIADDKDLS